MAPRLMVVAALLLAACITSAQEQKQSLPTNFSKWMEAKSGKAKVDSYNDYAESELQGACLRILNAEQCASRSGFDYYETDVGCCSEGYHKHQDTFRLPEDLKVGRCWWTVQSNGPVAVSDEVQLVGTYDMTCELEQQSERCGEPLCDDLVLRGSGRYYVVPNAAIMGKPQIPTECGYRRRRAQNPLELKPAQPVQQVVEPEQKPTETAQQPPQKPAEPAQKPAEPTQRPVEHTQQPPMKPAEPPQKPAEPAQKPAGPTPRPVEHTQQPPRKPAQRQQKPAQKPSEPAQRPAQPATQPPQEHHDTQPTQKPFAPVRKPAEQRAPTNPTKLASAEYYLEEEHQAEYWLGSAYVLDGHVQIISCSKKVAYKEGKMQGVDNYYIYDEATAEPIKPSPDQFIARPYVMDFVLRKSGDY